MREGALLGMSAEELQVEAKRIHEEMEQLAKWAALSKTEYGRFILEDKKRRVSMVSKLYSMVDVSKPNANVVVAHIQGYEEYLTEDVQKLEDAESYRKLLASYSQECHTVLQHKLKARTETRDDLVSGATQGDK